MRAIVGLAVGLLVCWASWDVSRWALVGLERAESFPVPVLTNWYARWLLAMAGSAAVSAPVAVLSMWVA